MNESDRGRVVIYNGTRVCSTPDFPNREDSVVIQSGTRRTAILKRHGTCRIPKYIKAARGRAALQNSKAVRGCPAIQSISTRHETCRTPNLCETYGKRNMCYIFEHIILFYACFPSIERIPILFTRMKNVIQLFLSEHC